MTTTETHDALLKLAGRKRCGICGASGRIKTYRGPVRTLPCHFCAGVGSIDLKETQHDQ